MDFKIEFFKSITILFIILYITPHFSKYLHMLFRLLLSNLVKSVRQVTNQCYTNKSVLQIKFLTRGQISG